ncbi:endonuclease [Neorhizobium sp. IRAMC:178]|uniref:endonuclease n=1 Tax=Neorhizobium tunisiense TaxID=3144793 RepID=UPI0031F63F56
MNAEFFLPWPDKKLSPNARVHWRTLARAKKQTKEFSYYRAMEAGLRKIAADTVAARYTFYPPSRRRFDLDNLIGRMKAGQDGIAMAIGVDDSKWTTTYKLAGPIEKAGMVKVELEWNEEAA